MVIFPLAPDQTIAQMWSNGARGGKGANNQTAWNKAQQVTIKVQRPSIALRDCRSAAQSLTGRQQTEAGCACRFLLHPAWYRALLVVV